MSDPKGFLKHPRETPERRPVAERLTDWKEFYQPIGQPELRAQAARCMDCGVPFCHGPQGCPVENHIPDWNDLIHQDRWREALRALHATNNFPEFTGRLCPAPCESACVLGINSDPVSIRVIEWNIIDHGFAQGWVQPVLARRKSGRKVAVVGSGPAGLAAAQQLARLGHEVVVIEKADRAGGLLRYGIPDFKMEKSVLDRRLEQLKQEGVAFRLGVEVGKDVTLRELRGEFAAVCLTIGAEVPRELGVPGRALKGVHFAMDYLIAQNRALADGRETGISATGKDVVILGGGDTGSDCLGTVLRQGARSVRQFEILARPPEARDPSTPWPHWPMQLRSSHAHEEGGIRDWSLATTELAGDASGAVTKLRAARLSSPDQARGGGASGAEKIEFAATLVLLAMGFTGPSAPLIQEGGLQTGARGAIAVDANFMTSEAGVFASGDATRGASLIVWAIAEGRKMASGVDRFLGKR